MDAPSCELKGYFSNQDAASKLFRNNIWKYNNALAITLLGCTVDYSINQARRGPYIFKVHGQLTYEAGTLLPPDQGNNQSPKYAQLYIYDPTEALEFCMD